MNRIENSSGSWLLALLYANNQKPIYGKLMFIKELFIAAHEIDEISETLRNVFKFYPGRYGPYSHIFNDAIENLKEENLIEVEEETIDNSTRYVFYLTEKGKENAENFYNTLPGNAKDKLTKLKRGAEQLGYTGILKHVYTHYPRYAMGSKIKGEVYEY
jgi:uncharacterized protein YwgA